MDDCISRQAVIKEIEKDQEKYRFADFSSYARCKDIIKNIPSVSQTKGIGKSKDIILEMITLKNIMSVQSVGNRHCYTLMVDI